MIKRNHELKVGEVVFDVNKMFFGIITNLENGKATLEMNKDFVHNFDCLKENLENFDCEIPEDEHVWETDDLDALYQMAWGIVESQEEFPLCYEHNTDIDYPYYCPYLDENFYKFETNEE